MTQIGDYVLDNNTAAAREIDASTSVSEALKAIFEVNMRPLYVRKDKILIGVFCISEYLKRVSDKIDSFSNHRVSDFMSTTVPCVGLDAELEYCLKIMKKNNYSYIAVRKNDHVLDILSFEQIVDFLIDRKEFLISQLTHYITGSPVQLNSFNETMSYLNLNEFSVIKKSESEWLEKAA